MHGKIQALVRCLCGDVKIHPSFPLIPAVPPLLPERGSFRGYKALLSGTEANMVTRPLHFPGKRRVRLGRASGTREAHPQRVAGLVRRPREAPYGPAAHSRGLCPRRYLPFAKARSEPFRPRASRTSPGTGGRPPRPARSPHLEARPGQADLAPPEHGRPA